MRVPASEFQLCLRCGISFFRVETFCLKTAAFCSRRGTCWSFRRFLMATSSSTWRFLMLDSRVSISSIARVASCGGDRSCCQRLGKVAPRVLQVPLNLYDVALELFDE